MTQFFIIVFSANQFIVLYTRSWTFLLGRTINRNRLWVEREYSGLDRPEYYS
jgi:hypothetical protein